jgi:acetamidase/formamidase
MTVQSIHSVNQDQFQHFWDRSVPPILTVRDNEPITITVREASNHQIHPGDGVDAITNLDFSRVNPIHGPIAVEGAKPGDVLQVEILEIETQGWGWTANIPGFGLLTEELPDPYLHLWELDPQRRRAQFKPGITVPLDPFIGVIGVAPSEPGQHSTVPPREVGGNMDVRYMRAGTTLYLPIAVENALFSLGDTHAAQGDGEICGTAIEAPARVTLSFNLHRSTPLRFPAYDVPGTLVRRTEEQGYHATTGIGPDLMEAAKDAARGMIDYLQRAHDLSPIEAYLLCSVAADLKISEIVDYPNWVVSYFLPNNIFTT